MNKIFKSIVVIAILSVPFVAFAMTDNFESYSNGATITDYTTYQSASFPNAGNGGGSNPSTKWEDDTGWLYAQVDSGTNMWGYSGKPSDWADRYFFRANTIATSADPIVSFDYKTAAFGANGFSVDGADATEIWLRFQSQYWLYIVSFDKTNNCIVAKRKVPTNDNATWGGATNQVANKGVYYTLFTDSAQPTFGAGYQCISWAGLGLANLAHDATNSTGTVYHFKVTAKSITHSPFNYVQLQLYRAGNLVASWTDKNDGTSANGRTTAQDVTANYWANVTGSTTAWLYPILLAGKGGLRADNIKTYIDNFSLTDGAVPPTDTIITVLATTTIPIGGSTHDTAQLDNVTDTAGGTAVYTIYTDNLCTVTSTAAGSKTVTNGNVPDSNTVTFNSGGTFYWQVAYSGDASNSSTVSICDGLGDEILTVSGVNVTSTIASTTSFGMPRGTLSFTKGTFTIK